MIQRDATNTARTIAQLTQRDAGNTLRTLVQLTMRDASNVLRTIYSAGGGTGPGGTGVSPAEVYGYADSYRPVRVVTDYATATAGAGATFAWTLTSGAGWTATNATSAQTAFRSPLISGGNSSAAAFSCTATYPNGASVVIGTVSAYAENYGSGSGSQPIQ